MKKEYEFTTCTGFKDGKPIEKTELVKESDLTKQQIDLLTGRLISARTNSPLLVREDFDKYMQQELNELKLTGSLISEKL